MKKQNGITLIALVITIIVLLILAGVSIAMLTGDNGILTKAGIARDETRDAEIKEALSLAASTIMAEQKDPTTNADATAVMNYATIARFVARDNASSNATPNGTTGIKYTYGGKVYNVTFSFINKKDADGNEVDPKVPVGVDLTTVEVELDTTTSGS